MDKRKAIQIMTKAADLYRENLEDQKILFLYGVPSEVKKQIQTEENNISAIKGYEVAFHRYNFLHLTEEDFFFSKDGSTGQKLEILESMMQIKHNVTMIGDFAHRGTKLYSEKAAGNVCACIGFVRDHNTKLNVPNTLLKKDIRDVTASPVQKVYAVISKEYAEEKYSVLEKIDKNLNLTVSYFSEQIERMLNRKSL